MITKNIEMEDEAEDKCIGSIIFFGGFIYGIIFSILLFVLLVWWLSC